MSETAPLQERSVTVLLQQAAALHKGAMAFVVTAMLGLGGVFAVIFWLWADWKDGYSVHPPLWEPAVAGLLGLVIGLGLSIPFVIWFRLQANLVCVQLSMEEHTRLASSHSEATVHTIRALADAGISGEWRYMVSGDLKEPPER